MVVDLGGVSSRFEGRKRFGGAMSLVNGRAVGSGVEAAFAHSVAWAPCFARGRKGSLRAAAAQDAALAPVGHDRVGRCRVRLVPSRSSSPGPLTPEEVEQFIEKGFVWVRQAFPREEAQRVVAEVFSGGRMERNYKRTHEGEERYDISGLPLDDCRAWQADRIDVETGCLDAIASFAPRLHQAIQQLLGNHESRRLYMGGKWILNLDYVEIPEDAPAMDPDPHAWHIDTPTPSTTLEGRNDALTLLVLWSDVEPKGGGTYFSTQGFHRVVDHLVQFEEGLDTTRDGWAAPFVLASSDARGQVGQAGDVLVTHGFMPHAAPRNHRRRVRILENPTVMVSRPLDYSPVNRHPAPVEEAVIRRINRLPELPAHLRRAVERGERRARLARVLNEQHPTAFFPGREYLRGLPEEDRKSVGRTAAWLLDLWIDDQLLLIDEPPEDPVSQMRGVNRVLRSVGVTTRAVRGLDPSNRIEDGQLAESTWFRMVLGVLNSDTLSYLAHRILKRMGMRNYVYRMQSRADGERSLVLGVREGRWGFVDPSSDCDLLTVPGLRFEGVQDGDGLEPLEGISTYAQWDARDFGRHGFAAESEYRKGRVVEFSDEGAELRAFDEVALDVRMSNYKAAEAEQAPASWRDFLELRVAILLGEVEDGVLAYQRYMEAHSLRGVTRNLVQALLGRARSDAAARVSTEVDP
jgi:hypothetical protein